VTGQATDIATDICPTCLRHIRPHPPTPSPPAGGELRDYQLKGLRWMVGLHRHGLNGILADEVGREKKEGREGG